MGGSLEPATPRGPRGDADLGRLAVLPVPAGRANGLRCGGPIEAMWRKKKFRKILNKKVEKVVKVEKVEKVGKG